MESHGVSGLKLGFEELCVEWENCSNFIRELEASTESDASSFWTSQHNSELGNLKTPDPHTSPKQALSFSAGSLRVLT